MKRRITTLFLLAAACLGLAALLPRPAAAADSSLKRMVLSPRDIPSALGSFHTTSPAALGLPPGGLAAASVPSSARPAHGYQGSYASFLTPAGGPSHGIILVESGVLRFASSGGAHWYLVQIRRGALLTKVRVTPATIGSEGIDWTEGGSNGAHLLFVFWRHGGYVGLITVGLRGSPRSSVALALARIADGKIR